jgi:DNA-binding MarR family transcriptional regulator
MFFEERDVRPRDLHSAFGVERSNLSHSLRGLEKKGFIKRSTHPTDARGYIFSLTSSGRKKALTLIQEFDRTQDRFESVFGVKKSRELVESIQSLVIEFEN